MRATRVADARRMLRRGFLLMPVAGLSPLVLDRTGHLVPIVYWALLMPWTLGNLLQGRAVARAHGRRFHGDPKAGPHPPLRLYLASGMLVTAVCLGLFIINPAPAAG